MGNVMTRIGWALLGLVVALLVVYRVTAPVTPVWFDVLLLGASALCVLIVRLLAMRRSKKKSDEIRQ
jgi:Flp pilus assembly protein TadB